MPCPVRQGSEDPMMTSHPGLVTSVLVLILVIRIEAQDEVYSRIAYELTEVPTDIPSNATKVDLTNNDITTVPDNAFSVAPGLREVDVSKNAITSFSSQALCGTVLQTINFEQNWLVAVPDMTCVGSTLKTIEMNKNGVTSLAQGAFANLPNLEDLQLVRNGLSGGLEAIGDLRPSLKVMSLAVNSIIDVGASLQNFPVLEVLELAANRIVTFPADALAGCDMLKTLSLGRNSLTVIPEFATVGDTLRELTLDRNNINNLNTDDLAPLTTLTYLNLYGNPLGDISAFSQWTGGSSLAKLLLSDIGVTSWPSDTFRHMTQLSILDLSANDLGTFPDLNVAAASITELNLASTGIHSLSAEEVAELTSIQELNLDDNGIVSWDDIEGVFALNGTLTTLTVSDNPLLYVDQRLYTMSALTTLDMSGCNLTCVPQPPAESALATVKLLHLELHCNDCLCWMLDARTELGIFVKLDDLPCRTPSALADTYWSNITASHLGCPEDTTVWTTQPGTTLPSTGRSTEYSPAVTTKLDTTERTSKTAAKYSTIITTESPAIKVSTEHSSLMTTVFRWTTDVSTMLGTSQVTTDSATTEPEVPDTTESTTEHLTRITTDQSTVLTREQSTFLTTEQSTVLTTERSTVLTREQSTVLTAKQSTVLTTEQSTVLTTEQSTLLNMEQSTVTPRQSTTDNLLATATASPSPSSSRLTTPAHEETPKSVTSSTQAERRASLSPTASLSLEPTGSTSAPEGSTDGSATALIPWSDWTACSAPCGTGTQLRFLLGQLVNTSGSHTWHDVLLIRDDLALGYKWETRSCNTDRCLVDRTWTLWGAWETCSATCGVGIIARRRLCVPMTSASRPCAGKETDYAYCEIQQCADAGSTRTLIPWESPFTEADKRASAKAIASIAMILLLVFAALFIVLDLPTFGQHARLAVVTIRDYRKRRQLRQSRKIDVKS